MWVGGRQLSEDGAPPCPSEGRSRGGWQRREAASRTVVRVRACPGQHVAHWASRRRGGSEPSPLDGGRRARAAPGPPPGARPRASASRAPATTRNLEPVLRPAAEWTGGGRRRAMRLIMFTTSWGSARPTTCPRALRVQRRVLGPRAPPRVLGAPVPPRVLGPCVPPSDPRRGFHVSSLFPGTGRPQRNHSRHTSEAATGGICREGVAVPSGSGGDASLLARVSWALSSGVGGLTQQSLGPRSPAGRSPGLSGFQGPSLNNGTAA